MFLRKIWTLPRVRKIQVLENRSPPEDTIRSSTKTFRWKRHSYAPETTCPTDLTSPSSTTLTRRTRSRTDPWQIRSPSRQRRRREELAALLPHLLLRPLLLRPLLLLDRRWRGGGTLSFLRPRPMRGWRWTMPSCPRLRGAGPTCSSTCRREKTEMIVGGTEGVRQSLPDCCTTVAKPNRC